MGADTPADTRDDDLSIKDRFALRFAARPPWPQRPQVEVFGRVERTTLVATGALFADDLEVPERTARLWRSFTARNSTHLLRLDEGRLHISGTSVGSNRPRGSHFGVAMARAVAATDVVAEVRLGGWVHAARPAQAVAASFHSCSGGPDHSGELLLREGDGAGGWYRGVHAENLPEQPAPGRDQPRGVEAMRDLRIVGDARTETMRGSTRTPRMPR